MRIIERALDDGRKPQTTSITVSWSQNLMTWEENVTRPIVAVGIADRYLEMNMSEANELKRKLEDVIMDIEEAKLWM